MVGTALKWGLLTGISFSKIYIAMMNKRKSNPQTLLKAVLLISLIVLMVQVFAQKEIKQAAVSQKVPVTEKYLILKPDQLKILGFEWSSNGLFYKNTRVDRPDKGVLCLYLTENIYCTSILLKKDEVIPGRTVPDRILKKQQLTGNDFYPVVVAGFNRSRTLDITTSQQNLRQKLLPLQVNMADLKLGERKDTLVFWFKPTEALKERLKGIANIEEYIQALPPNK
jgi:hypothetical protein